MEQILVCPPPSPASAKSPPSDQIKKQDLVDDFLNHFKKRKPGLIILKMDNNHKNKTKTSVVVVVVRRPSVVVRLPLDPQKANSIRKFHKELVCGSGDMQIV